MTKYDSLSVITVTKQPAISLKGQAAYRSLKTSICDEEKAVQINGITGFKVDCGPS